MKFLLHHSFLFVFEIDLFKKFKKLKKKLALFKNVIKKVSFKFFRTKFLDNIVNLVRNN